jgi:hypothetical protein
LVAERRELVAVSCSNRSSISPKSSTFARNFVCEWQPAATNRIHFQTLINKQTKTKTKENYEQKRLSETDDEGRQVTSPDTPAPGEQTGERTGECHNEWNV